MADYVPHEGKDLDLRMQDDGFTWIGFRAGEGNGRAMFGVADDGRFGIEIVCDHAARKVYEDGVVVNRVYFDQAEDVLRSLLAWVEQTNRPPPVSTIVSAR